MKRTPQRDVPSNRPDVSAVHLCGDGTWTRFSRSAQLIFQADGVPSALGTAGGRWGRLPPRRNVSICFPILPPLSPLGSLRRSVFTGLLPGGTTFGGKKGDIQLTSISRLESRTVAPGEAERRAAGRPQRAEAPGNDPVNAAAAAAFTAVFLNLV